MRASPVAWWRSFQDPQRLGRFVRYSVIGASGAAVSMVLLWWLKGVGHLGTLAAGAIAIECAILHNFIWHEAWTFRDRKLHAPGLRERWGRLVRFHCVCGVGASLQLALLWLLADGCHWHYLAANGTALGLVLGLTYRLNAAWARAAPAGSS